MKLHMFLFAVVALASSSAQAVDHIWSKQGTVFYLVLGNEGVGHVKPHRAYSPDHTKWLQVDFAKGRGDGDAIPVMTLANGSQRIPIKLDKNWAQVEVLWSPDSNSFALTGGFNAYTNSTRIIGIADGSIRLVSLDLVAQDMANTYPPCKAAKADPANCHAEESGKDFNYATVTWSDPTTAVIMAEIPCSSSQGGIMCQIEGYEVYIHTGNISRRMNAREFKARWQSQLNWNLRIPDPPEWKRAR